MGGARLAVTDDPRLSVTVRLHVCPAGHGSPLLATSAQLPSVQVGACAANMTAPVEVIFTE